MSDKTEWSRFTEQLIGVGYRRWYRVEEPRDGHWGGGSVFSPECRVTFAWSDCDGRISWQISNPNGERVDLVGWTEDDVKQFIDQLS